MHEHGELLLIEDDDAMRAAVERILRSAGHEVRAFASAEALLSALQGQPLWPGIACGICDVRLPGACGFELQRALAARGPAPAWIFTTAHDEPAFRERAQRMQASYLPKPFDGRTLLALVARALSQGAGRATPQAN